MKENCSRCKTEIDIEPWDEFECPKCHQKGFWGEDYDDEDFWAVPIWNDDWDKIWNKAKGTK